MHPITEVGTNVSAFLAKLWRMVEDPETNDLICWNTDGTTFMIKNQSQFAKELLPMYYKHNNMASFIRQLNMYGFHKVVSAESNGLRMTDNDEIAFSHHCFIRGHPYLLEHIKRKMTVTKDNNEIRTAPDIMNKVLNDVKSMKGRQESLDSKLSTMKQENEALWRELTILRQKHAKQQQIVNKLIQFLVTLVHPTRNLSVKKRNHFPLMLKDRAHYHHHNGHKQHFTSESRKRHHSGSSDSTTPSPTGPTIHELDPSDFLETVHVLDGNQRSASLLRSASPLSPTITDCDSGDGDISVDSPSIIGSKIRSNLDDGTLLDLVSEAVSPAEELITVPPKKINPVNPITRSTTRTVTASKTAKDKKFKPITFKADQAMEQKLTKRRGGRVKRVVSPTSSDSAIKSMLTKSKPNPTQSVQKIGLRVKRPVRQVTNEANGNKRLLIPNVMETQVGNGTGVIDPLSSLDDVSIPEDISLQEPEKLLLDTDASGMKEDGTVSPIISTPGSLPVEIGEASPVGIVTVPSPTSGELQQIFDPSPINEPILGMSNNYLPENQTPTSSGEAVDNRPVLSVSPNEILNQVTSTSPVEPSINDMALTLSSPSQTSLSVSGNDNALLSRSGDLFDINSHVDSMQSDLDCLKELLQKEGLSLDANVFMNLFSQDDPLNLNTPAYPNPLNQMDQTDMNQGYNQLTTYNPSNLDLSDVFHNSDWNVPMTGQTNEEDELFKDLNTPIISIQNSPLNTPSPSSSSSKKRRK